MKMFFSRLTVILASIIYQVMIEITVLRETPIVSLKFIVIIYSLVMVIYVAKVDENIMRIFVVFYTFRQILFQLIFCPSLGQISLEIITFKKYDIGERFDREKERGTQKCLLIN